MNKEVILLNGMDGCRNVPCICLDDSGIEQCCIECYKICVRRCRNTELVDSWLDKDEHIAWNNLSKEGAIDA